MNKLEQAAREVIRQHSMECLSDKAVDSLREALAEQTEQEPVEQHTDRYWLHEINNARADGYGRGYTAGKSAAPQPVKQEPVAWKHDCAALCANHVELWIDNCPHCGKPRPAPVQQAEQSQLADASLEPVGYFAYDEERDIWEELTGPNAPGATPLYAAPVQQVDLTDDEIQEVMMSVSPTGMNYFIRIARAVIAAFKEKNK